MFALLYDIHALGSHRVADFNDLVDRALDECCSAYYTVYDLFGEPLAGDLKSATRTTVKQKLENFGFELSYAITGKDLYFTTIKKEEVKTATYANLLNSSIIIRSIKNLNQQNYETKLVYKNKVIEGNTTLSEQKFETRIDSEEGCKNILTLFGLNNWISLSQTNFFYKKGEIEVGIGTVEGIPYSILEIEEYPSISNLNPEEKIKILTSLAKSFGFELGLPISIKSMPKSSNILITSIFSFIEKETPFV